MTIPLREQIELAGGRIVPAFRGRPIRVAPLSQRIRLLGDIQARAAAGEATQEDLRTASEFQFNAPTRRERDIGKELVANIQDLINTQRRLAESVQQVRQAQQPIGPGRIRVPGEEDIITPGDIGFQQQQRIIGARQRQLEAQVAAERPEAIAKAGIPALQKLQERTELVEARRIQIADFAARIKQVQQKIPGVPLAEAINIVEAQVAAERSGERADVAFERQVELGGLRAQLARGEIGFRAVTGAVAGEIRAGRAKERAIIGEKRRSELIAERAKTARDASATQALESFNRQQQETNRRHANTLRSQGVPVEEVEDSETGEVRVTGPKPTTTRAKAQLARAVQEQAERTARAKQDFVDDVNRSRRDARRGQISGLQEELRAVRSEERRAILDKDKVRLRSSVVRIVDEIAGLNRKPPKMLDFAAAKKQARVARVTIIEPERIEVHGFTIPVEESTRLDTLVTNILTSRNPDKSLQALLDAIEQNDPRIAKLFENPSVAIEIILREIEARGR